MKIRDKTSRSWLRALPLGVLVVLSVLSMATGAASADVTHKYLYSFPVTEESFRVSGVDGDGNVYLYDQTGGDNTITRYNPVTGEHVPFPALESNVIDGSGGTDCPAVKQDCDRVPSNDLFSTIYNGAQPVAVSTAPGPTNGYIYAANSSSPARVVVFAPSGEYLGQIDPTGTFPLNTAEGDSFTGLSVDANGHVYVGHYGFVIDEFAPVDGNPAHDAFVGQLRGWGLSLSAAGVNYTYSKAETLSPTHPYYGAQKFTAAEYLLPSGEADPISLAPDSGPFGGESSCFEFYQQPAIYVDPHNEDAYLSCTGGSIQQWSESNQQIGPSFGAGQVAYEPLGIGFDRSGGANDGRLYVRGSENGERSVAVYSPMVTIPDITSHPPAVGHDTATVSASLSLAGGPEVTECYVAWDYGMVPCDVPTPYTEATEVSAKLEGLSPETDYGYRFVVVNENGVATTKAAVVRPLAVLGVTTDSATSIGLTTATLNGSLDADGMPTEYHFQYGLTKAYSSETPSQPAGSEVGSVAVEGVELSQLQVGRTYHYALVASNSLGTTVGPDRTFSTAAPPEVSGVVATDVGASQATLRGRVNPVGFDTTYYFEYGRSPEYGSKIPTSPVSIGSGVDDQQLSEEIVGLQPGIVYHFRLVAENTWGTTRSDDTTFSFEPPNCPNSLVRQQSNSSYLPDCRAHELVSPADAGAVQLFPGTIRSGIGELARDPEYRITSHNSGLANNPSRFSYYAALGSIKGLNTPNSLIDMYVANRTTTGWVTTHPGLAGDEASTTGHQQCDMTLSTCLDYRARPFIYFGKWRRRTSAYVWDVATGRNLGRWPTNIGVIPEGENFRGTGKASPDFSHYAFSSNDRAFAPGGLLTAPGSVYDNDIADATLTIVSKLPDGSPIPLQPANSGNVDEFLLIPAMSTDGSHILMSTASEPVCELQDQSQCPLPGPVSLYMTVNDEVSYDITEGATGMFVGMTENGEKVFFTSDSQLTDDDTDGSTDLFMWSEGTDSLTRISQGNGAGDGDSCSAGWTNGCGVAVIEPEYPDTDNVIARDSGDIYFYSPENLDGNRPGVPNERNLYAYRHGEVDLVATFDPGTEVDRSQISPDGDNAAFVSAARLTGYDNQGFREMYRYRPNAGGLIECLSCIPSGLPPAHDVRASNGGPFMTDDGRAAFATIDPLVPADTDGITDVYEFTEGRPQLISSGVGESEMSGGGALLKAQQVGLEAFSADGTDLYFSTLETLTPDDQNGHYVKFYDARTGGGFTVQSNFAPCAAADECHGSGAVSPEDGLIATEVPLGKGRKGKSAKRKARKRARRHKSRHRSHRTAKSQSGAHGGSRNG